MDVITMKKQNEPKIEAKRRSSMASAKEDESKGHSESPLWGEIFY
jgi:hypothetical protein